MGNRVLQDMPGICVLIIACPLMTSVLCNVPHSFPPDENTLSPPTTSPDSGANDLLHWQPKVPFDAPNDVRWENITTSTSTETPEENRSSKRYAVATFDFHHVATPYIISLWIIIVGLAKIGFHVTPKLSSICPESVVLMILGVLIGILLFYGGIEKHGAAIALDSPTFQQPLTPTIFFMYMLPPIVMDAGYHMPNRLFFDNLMSILLHAVLGTIWNALTIGVCLYYCAQTGMFGVEIPLLDMLLFTSIVSAVDPVAVLAVFEEIHVNEVLYILVFGESLLNDAVTVVLYHMFEGYTEMGAENILPVDLFAGLASFFVIALGGTLMGVIWGFAAAFVSRFTHHVRIIEPIFVFVMAYLSYLSAEMFHLSGILSLTFCGITMKNYVEENITETSATTLKYAMKMLANSSESVIFLFLGVCTVTDNHDWNTLFVILTIFFALVFRTLGVILFTSILNRYRLHKMTAIEQFIMSYGGLRGAVAFALVLVVNERIIPTKKMMVTTIIAIVYFTVFLQGMTIGPLVKILKVPRANKFEMSMNERINSRLMDHVMAGMEDISGMMIGNYKMRDKFRHFNNKYLKHWFIRDSHETGNSTRKIFETYSRLNLQDAINIVNKQNNGQYNNNNPPEKTLSSMFRTLTESNISTSESQSTGSSLPPSFTSICIDNNSAAAGSFNFDLANLDYSPSRRDLVEAEIHHILADNLFKPVRKFRKYSKCDLPESPDTVQMQHMARHQVSPIVVQNVKKRKARRGKSIHFQSQEPFTGTRVPVVEEVADEEGIVFQAADDARDEDGKNMTAVESILPWRRKSSFTPDDQSVDEDNLSLVLKQQEFPAWISNKQYLSQYASPSTTVIKALDRDRNHVFQVFAEDVVPADAASGGATTDKRDEEKARTQTSDRASSTRTSEDNGMSGTSGTENRAFVPDENPVTKL